MFPILRVLNRGVEIACAVSSVVLILNYIIVLKEVFLTGLSQTAVRMFYRIVKNLMFWNHRFKNRQKISVLKMYGYFFAVCRDRQCLTGIKDLKKIVCTDL